MISKMKEKAIVAGLLKLVNTEQIRLKKIKMMEYNINK